MPDEAARISVRGEARLTVAPDLVHLSGVLTCVRASKPEALAAAAAALERLTADLASRGGRPLRPAEERHALTWSAHAAASQPEHRLDERTGRYETTDRVRADVSVLVVVRDLDRLDDVGAVLARHEALSVHGAAWAVDADNPAWPQVRAAAVRDALRKAGDYAAALGGSVGRVEHVADASLLGGAGAGTEVFAAQAAGAAGGWRGEAPDVPSLDPLPQELVAVVEARVAAVGVGLEAG